MIFVQCLDAALAFVASIVGRVNIAVALVPSSLSIIVMLSMCCLLPSSCHCTVHRHCAPLSITIELSLCRPWHCASTVPCCPSPPRSRRAVVREEAEVEGGGGTGGGRSASIDMRAVSSGWDQFTDLNRARQWGGAATPRRRPQHRPWRCVLLWW